MPRPVLRISTGVGAAVIVAATVTAQVGGAGPAVHVAAAATTPSPTPSSTPTAHKTPDPALTAAIKDRMSLATARTWAAVVDVEGVGRVVDVNGSAGLLPASTEKLFTTLPLLQQRPNDRLTTTIGAASAPARGVLQGDLVVRASGDPTLMGAGLVDLAKQVRAHGVTRVTGRLVLNIGHLSGARTRSGWKSSYVPGDVGPLSPFPVHYDAWRSAASYVAHPTVANLALLRSKLVAAGVHIAGGDVIARTGNTATTLATHSSATLRTIISHTLRWSDNFMAEQMLSIEGMSAVAATAGAAGASGSATDGSGLSLSDRRTAHGEVALLKAAHNGPAAAALLASLPVACSTGTLEHEMCHTSAAGKVFAKTGTLAHTKALAGYTTDAQGRLVSFAFLTGGDVSTSKAMNAIERSVILLRHYAG
jgi:D-alanyl-D-alanine carboxypeptidase/D-alanyl-D-alanine-endopeptidase (penicillin-binding protein 4)